MKNTLTNKTASGLSKNNTMEKTQVSDVAQGLRDLLGNELKDILWAEKALTKGIPKMIKNATSEELITALENHLDETTNHVTRLEEIFASLDMKVVSKKCDAMEGLLKEANSIMEDTEKGVVRDAGIILAAQKVEHYEIATYGTLLAFATALGENEAADLLEETLNEEKGADETLSEIAMDINVEALNAGDENENPKGDKNMNDQKEIKTGSTTAKRQLQSKGK